MQPVNADAGAEIGLAWWLCEALRLPATNGDRLLYAECIRHLANGGDLKAAADAILKAALRYEREGKPVDFWWFKQRHYLASTPPNPGAQRETVTEDEAYLQWGSMSDAFKAANPWHPWRQT